MDAEVFLRIQYIIPARIANRRHAKSGRRNEPGVRDVFADKNQLILSSLDFIELDVHAGDFVRELDLDAVLHELGAREGLFGGNARFGVKVQLGQLVFRVRVEAGGLDGLGPRAAVALEAKEDGLGLVLGDEREFGRLGIHRAASAVEVCAVEERTELLVDGDALRNVLDVIQPACALGLRIEFDAETRATSVRNL